MEQQKNLFNKIVDPGELAEIAWKREWTDMPEFIVNDKRPILQLIVSFENEEDIKLFSKLVEQNIHKDSKSIWFPKRLREPPSNFLWSYIKDESQQVSNIHNL